MASSNQKEVTSKPYAVSTLDLNGRSMTLTRPSVSARTEERRLLEENLRDKDNNGLTGEECVRLIRIFSTGELPVSYAEVWRAQKDRDEGRLLMAQARLRATMAKQPPPLISALNEAKEQSPQGEDESSEGAPADDSLDHPGSSSSSSVARSQSPQQASESQRVAPRRGIRHRSEPEEEYRQRVKRAPIITRPRRPEDLDCPRRDGPPTIWWMEEDSEGNLVRLALDRLLPPDADTNIIVLKPGRDSHRPQMEKESSSANRTQALENPRKRRLDDADKDGDDAPTTSLPRSTAQSEAPEDFSTRRDTATTRPSGMTLLPGVGKDWGVRRRILAEAERQRRSEGPPKADAT